VEHGETRCRKVIRKAAQQGDQSLNPARGSADHDDITVGHGEVLAKFMRMAKPCLIHLRQMC
jgi:hypothetical protein